MKKPQYAHADAHVIARARLTASDFEKINIEVAKAIQFARDKAAAEQRPQRSEDVAQAAAPISNTGGKSIQLVVEGGKIKQVLPRVHSENEVCFLDWVSITCHESSFQWNGSVVSDEQLIAEVSSQCESMFGFGITSKREKGLNFYRTSYILGDKFGHVCYGGQRNTVMIQLSGAGCTAAKEGWERKLHDFLKSAVTARITRIDLSHDDIEGKQFSMESLEKAYDDGSFNNGGRNPDIEMHGNWKNPNGKGRTIYVGNRANGKFFRGYEKGCQLGSPSSTWIRLEVVFKSEDRIIPFDTLLRPQDYFAASYPIFVGFSTTAQRILTTQKTVEVSYERTKQWLKHQCGAALNLMYQVEGSHEKVLEMVMREGKIPRGIEVPSYLTAGEFLHNQEKAIYSDSYIAETFERY